MAISYVGGVTGGRAGATSTTTQSLSGTLTGGSGASPIAGDLVVVYCSVGWDTTPATSQTISGNNNGAYNNVAFQSADDTNDTGSQLNYKIQGGTVDTSITIPSSASVRNAQRWVVHVFRNVDPTTPLDVTSAPASGIDTGRPDPTAITPSTTGAWIVAYYASAAATGTAYTSPGLSGWLGNTTADTVDCMQGGGYYSSWTSGSYDPPAITAGGTTGTGDSWTAMTIALRPSFNNYPLTCTKGDYTYSGQSAVLTKSKVIVSTAGSYTYSGQSAVLSRGRFLTATAGSYSYTGQSATLSRNRTLIAQNGSYTYAGQDVVITYVPSVIGYTLTAEAGSYAYTGQSAALYKSKVLAASAGSYAYTGQNSILLRSKYLAASAGNYTYTGQNSSYTHAYTYPPPQYVLEGIMYGPTGTEFIGTLVPGFDGTLKYDIESDRLVLLLSNKVCMSI